MNTHRRTRHTRSTAMHLDRRGVRVGFLLDELDAMIAHLDAAIGDANAARLVMFDTETEMAVIEASVTLATTGANAAARKAAMLLALRDDAAYQTFAAAVRDARVNLFHAERTIAVVKQRIGLMPAAVLLHTDEPSR